MSDSTSESSDFYTDDPVIVFDQNSDDGDENSPTPIGFGFRQPSFVRLHGVPIPKGFGSLADFKAEKPPVKVERFKETGMPSSDENSTTQSIRELLRRRNAQKWKEMGYDPEVIERSLNRNVSHSTIVSTKNNFAVKKPISNSFNNIDSVTVLNERSQNLSLAPVSEEKDIFRSNQNLVSNQKKLTRSLSSGKNLPSIEMPNNFSFPFQTDLFKGNNSNLSSSSSSDEEIVVEEDLIEHNNIPPNLRPFIIHAEDSFTYRALEGENLRELLESAKELVINDLNYYLEIAIDNGLFSEICYIQNIIENLKTDNYTQSVQEMSELDYRIYEKSIDIEDHIKLWKQQENKIISEKNQSLKILDHRFEEASREIKQQSQIQSQINLNEDSQIQLQRITKLYQSERASIINMFNTKIESLNTLKDQCLASLTQRLLLLKRQKEELLNGQQKVNSQNELLKPKAASSRPVAPLFSCKTLSSPIKIPNLNVIQENYQLKSQYQGLRPSTPGGPIIFKPKTLKHPDTNF